MFAVCSHKKEVCDDQGQVQEKLEGVHKGCGGDRFEEEKREGKRKGKIRQKEVEKDRGRQR